MGLHRITTSFHLRAVMWLAVTPCLAGCMVGPKYRTPPVDTPAAYKELIPADFKNTEGWKVAQPKDDALRGAWWEIFDDPQLNALEQKVNVSNQNIAAAVASFFAARALVKEARSQLFPTVTTNPAITVQRQSSTVSNGGAGAPERAPHPHRGAHLLTIRSRLMRRGSQTSSVVSGTPSDQPLMARKLARPISRIPASPSRPTLPKITFSFADRMP